MTELVHLKSELAHLLLGVILANVLCIGFVSGQSENNLVANGAFDEVLSCPSDINQLTDLVPNWQSVVTDDLEIYCRCESEDGLPFISVPESGIPGAYQNPLSENCYAGFINFFDSENETHQFIQSQLIHTLLKGNKYYVEYYVNPRLRPEFDDAYYTEPIQLSFLPELRTRNNNIEDLYAVEIAIEDRSILTDSMNWTRINGVYQAGGFENVIILGNFRSIDSTLTLDQTPNIAPNSSYTFLEDVLVQQYDPLPDTIITCRQEEVILEAKFRDADYLWNTGDTTSSITVRNEGQYFVTSRIGKAFLSDTVEIINLEDVTSFQETDIIKCIDELIVLDPLLPGDRLWSNGEVGNRIIVSDAGMYEVIVTNGCGEFTTIFNVGVEDCTCKIYVPNIFSPNNDGINDEIEVYYDCQDIEFEAFEVFDRWGNKVYSTSTSDRVTWNGDGGSSGCIYVYKLVYKIREGGLDRTQIDTGNITLLK